MTVQVCKVLVLSTRHIPGPTAIDSSWTWGEYGEGCWCYAYDDPSCVELRLEWLLPICALARQHGCEWIRFDADACTEDLPTFDQLWP